MSVDPLISPQEPEYAWELATMYPPQGTWTEEEYLELTDHSNRRIEFVDGRLEFLSMPTEVHETLARFLFLALYNFVVKRNLGEVFSTGIRVRVLPKRCRLPDVLFLHKNNFHLRHNRVWDGIDLAMEVVSDDPRDRKRDYQDKMADYANAGIAEYWIVDPEQRTVIVHQLQDGKYRVHGQFDENATATSALLAEFTVDVSALFASIDDIPE
jgi:Uma2 family endonuclease